MNRFGWGCKGEDVRHGMGRNAFEYVCFGGSDLATVAPFGAGCMNASEPSWTDVLQRSVFGWIIGGAIFLGGLIGLSMLIASVVDGNINSRLSGLAALLYYGFFFGSFAAAHGFFLVSVLGLVVLPFRGGVRTFV